jgi:GR25 family glycosyltransferase involved in LPS biosynthesis
VNEESMKHIEAYRISHRTLKDNYIAVMLEHLFALQKAVQDNVKIAMIVEDDVIFCDGFSDKIVNYMNQLPDNWDVFYPGEACNQRLPQTDPNKNVYLHPQKSTRTSYFYIMKIETIKRILTTIIPFTLAVDFELTYQYWNHNMNVYWGEPSLSKQGSEIGVYKSLACDGNGNRI